MSFEACSGMSAWSTLISQCHNQLASSHNCKSIKKFHWTLFLLQTLCTGLCADCRPLHKLFEKSETFQWTDECQSTFEILKQKPTESPILAYPLPDIEFILDTDASDKAVDSARSQIQDGSERVIACISKTMNKHEQQYCELLAVDVALKTFHYYLWSKSFLTYRQSRHQLDEESKELNRPDCQVVTVD